MLSATIHTSSVTHSRNCRGTQQQASSCRQVIHLLCFAWRKWWGQWTQSACLCWYLCTYVCICVCVCSGMFFPVSVPMYVDVCQQPSLCLKQKSPLVHVEKRGLKEEWTWILSFSGLTLARPPLANSRQQIRSWELPTGPVTGA